MIHSILQQVPQVPYFNELLVAFEALGGSPTDNESDRTPLGRHEFGEVEEFLVLFLLFFLFNAELFKKEKEAFAYF